MPSCRGNKTIYVDFEDQATYEDYVNNKDRFRHYLELKSKEHPELFPPRINQGFTFHASRISIKLNLKICRILVKQTGDVLFSQVVVNVALFCIIEYVVDTAI